MKTILLVDDDPILIKVYGDALKRGGYRVEFAEDGLVAMKMLLPLCPDVVLLDVLMPKMDGQYVLQYIRSRPELKSTMVIVLSNATLADAGNATLAQNPDVALMKSEATPKALLRIINELVGNA